MTAPYGMKSNSSDLRSFLKIMFPQNTPIALKLKRRRSQLMSAKFKVRTLHQNQAKGQNASSFLCYTLEIYNLRRGSIILSSYPSPSQLIHLTVGRACKRHLPKIVHCTSLGGAVHSSQASQPSLALKYHIPKVDLSSLQST